MTSSIRSTESFTSFVKNNRSYAWFALAISIAFLIILRSIYPVPSYFADSFTYVGAAAKNQPVTFRPIMYSRLIQFFHLFSRGDLALIAAQYAASVIANLLLFYTTCWLFGFRRWYKWILYFLLIIHPFYLFASNYISSDAFFNSFAVCWFTLLLWIMYKPRWYIVSLHIALLVMLFMLRFNAIYFPFFTAIALAFSGLKLWKKITIISAIVIIIAGCMEYTSIQTKNLVGTKIFSGFSGWQFANNALHIVRFKNIDTTAIDDKNTRELLRFNKRFFAISADHIPAKATAWYMWHPHSPLKAYLKNYDSTAGYFRTWNKLAPMYGKFGRTIILQNPGAYCRYFVLPNSKEYFYPQLEIYETYFEDADTVARVAQQYFHYKTNLLPKHHPVLYAAVFKPYPLLFLLLNVFIIIVGVRFLVTKRYLVYTKLMNRFVLCYALFFAANFLFVVLLAPSVLRYHISILTLGLPIVLFLWKDLKIPAQNFMGS